MMKSIYISSCVPDGGVWRCGFDGETLTKRDFSPVGRVMYTAREGDTIYAVSLEPDSLDSFVVQAKLTDGRPGTFGGRIRTGRESCFIDVRDGDFYTADYSSAGVTKNDTVQVSYGYGLFTGGLGLHYGVEKIGATVVPTSAGNTKRQLMLMQDLGCDAVACTPSYALMMGETIRDQKMDLSNFKLRVGLFGAEPWTEGMRDEIEKLLGIKALDIYGLTESAGPGVAMECLEGREGLHMWEDYFIPEIIDPATGEPLPDGEMGELTITTIGKEGMPTIRFRTHDLTSIIPEPCKCGRTHRRIRRLHGRTDDMLIIRGVNVFPSQVESAITGIPGIAPRYLLIVDRVHNLDTLEVQVELLPELVSDEVRKIEALQDRVKRAIEQVLGLGVNLRLMPPNSIERSQGKTQHTIDKRKLL